MGNPFDPMNIILLVFAVVAFIRLRATLGKRTGNEDPLDNKNIFQPKKNRDIKNFEKTENPIPHSKEEILDYLTLNDKNFTQESFLEGSKNAYKMIVQNYASGDLNSIKDFIGKEVYDGFSEAISSRNELKQNNHHHVGMSIVCPAYVNTGMFDGVKEPLFIPMLRPEKLAKKIIKAVLKNKRFVLEPAFIKFIPIIKALSPNSFFDFLGCVLGGYSSMKFWKGHKK